MRPINTIITSFFFSTSPWRRNVSSNGPTFLQNNNNNKSSSTWLLLHPKLRKQQYQYCSKQTLLFLTLTIISITCLIVFIYNFVIYYHYGNITNNNKILITPTTTTTSNINKYTLITSQSSETTSSSSPPPLNQQQQQQQRHDDHLIPEFPTSSFPKQQLTNQPTTTTISIPESVERMVPANSCGIYPGPFSSFQLCCDPTRLYHHKSHRTLSTNPESDNDQHQPSSSIFCIPTLIIAGAQKAGTTAIHSYLLFLRHYLQPPKYKELHMFDNDKNFARWIRRTFENYNPILRHETFNEITFETTPSYIASVMSCPRMAKMLPTSTRFVVILRDPTSRVWSEINMKRRRILSQADFLKVQIPNHYKELKQCLQNTLANNPMLSSTTDEQQQQQQQPLWQKSSQMMKRMILLGTDGIGDTNSKIPKSSFGMNNANAVEEEQFNKFKSCLVDLNVKEFANHGKLLLFYRNIIKSRTTTENFINICLTSFEEARRCSMRGGAFENAILRETMPDIPNILYTEMLNLQDMRINPDGCRNQQSNHQPDQQQQLQLPVTDATSNNNLHNISCQGPGCRCFPRVRIISDISKNFIWRSLYYPQLRHCFTTIPQERFLFIDANELRTSPSKVILNIINHVFVNGKKTATDALMMENINFNQLSLEEIDSKFQSLYPDFESRTGWGHQNMTNHEIPPELKMKLDEYFAPHNDKLFELLNVKKFKGWS
jgi:hypothetical protein